MRDSLCLSEMWERAQSAVQRRAAAQPVSSQPHHCHLSAHLPTTSSSAGFLTCMCQPHNAAHPLTFLPSTHAALLTTLPLSDCVDVAAAVAA